MRKPPATPPAPRRNASQPVDSPWRRKASTSGPTPTPRPRRNGRTCLNRQGRKPPARSRRRRAQLRTQDRARQRRALEAEARQLAVTIAARLLARIPPQAATAALLEMLDAWLATLPAADLTNLAGAREPLEVATAAALDEAAQAACAAMLRRRLGDGLRLRFVTDPR